MKIGIIGLPQTGKKTLFELLTNYRPSEKDLISNKPIKGIAEIRDPRFDKLVEIYKPKKEVRARIDLELFSKMEKEAIRQGDVFADVADVDAICHIVRAFRDDSIYHVEGSVDPKRDIDNINSELILSDMLFIEKRLERIEKNIKKIKDENVLKEKDVLLKFKAQLEKELPLRLVDLGPEERKIISSYPFVTLKQMIIALNVSDEDFKNKDMVDKFKADYLALQIDVMQVSAKIEAEVAKLESELERKEFLSALGIDEPAINVLTRLLGHALNLISFFTVGPDEVRQWTIKANSTAPEAAGAIHTDLQHGFIRAEVLRYQDLIELGSEEKVKESGRLYLKGKDYIVEDGDVLSIRFNV